MSEDMPTVDGARAEAERRVDEMGPGAPGDGPIWDAGYRIGFEAGAHWLAPTVAALEAEVERQTARADAAEARLRAVEALGAKWLREQAAYPDTDPGRMAAAAVRLCAAEIADMLRSRINFPTALSDAAPQAVGRRDQVLSVADVLPNGTYTLTVTDEGASIGTRPEPAERRVLAAVNAYLRTLDRKPGEVMTAAEVARQIRSRIVFPDATDGREGA